MVLLTFRNTKVPTAIKKKERVVAMINEDNLKKVAKRTFYICLQK